MKKNFKIGIALGSGGAKGLVHIGVLQVLAENKIPISHVSGSSIGSVIGGLYALGISPYDLEKKSVSFGGKSKKDFLKLSINSKSIYDIKNIHDKLLILYGDKKFDDLKIPFYPVATDLITGDKIVFDSGKLIDAVEASSRIPVYFEPLEKNDSKLVDGGLISPIPIDVLKDKCDFVIAVPIITFNKKKLPNYKLKIANVLNRSLSIITNVVLKYELKASKPDFIIPMENLHEYGGFDFHKAKELIEIGRNTAIKFMPELKKKIREKEKKLNIK